jgi:N-acetylneuraminic acid mutarotase
MDYYEGKLYVYSKETLSVFNLIDKSWDNHRFEMCINESLSDYSQCIYNNSLYLIPGWHVELEEASRKIFRIELSDSDYNACELIDLKQDKEADDKLKGYSCKDNQVYLFGGSNKAGYSNNLSLLDLSEKDLEFQILSRRINVPTARKGHAMEAYDDKLYIFGGVDGNGNE